MFELFKEPIFLIAIAIILILRPLFQDEEDKVNFKPKNREKRSSIFDQPETPPDDFIINKAPCPQCKLESQNLEWTYFRSADWTWKNLCGRAGYDSRCPDCKIHVEFICTMMN
jgi:hypothetical protein